MTILELEGAQVLNYLDPLAGLRLNIFREYPYLYDGQLEDERRYLSGYADQGLVLLALDAGRVAGAITGMPLAKESEAFVAPFRNAGLAPEQFYYIGDGVYYTICAGVQPASNGCDGTAASGDEYRYYSSFSGKVQQTSTAVVTGCS